MNKNLIRNSKNNDYEYHCSDLTPVLEQVYSNTTLRRFLELATDNKIYLFEADLYKSKFRNIVFCVIIPIISTNFPYIHISDIRRSPIKTLYHNTNINFITSISKYIKFIKDYEEIINELFLLENNKLVDYI